MKTNIPIKNLAQSNWLMAIISTGFLSIFLLTYVGFNSEVLFTLVKNTVSTIAISFVDMIVLLQLEKHGIRLLLNKIRLLRYAVTYVTTLIYSFCTSPLRPFFADKSWHTITEKQELVTNIVGSLILCGVIWITHNLVIAYLAKNDAEVENAELKAANAEANNLLLKQQIHPHFLFNALNIIKTLYKKDARAGDVYIVHLANFLRAAVSTTSAKVVNLNDEIKLCADYIAMQKIRFGDALQYIIDIAEAESKDDFVPSFSLQPLLENAIKHNEVTDEAPLFIKVFKKDGYVVVENNLQKKKQLAASTGNGLVNLTKRYNLISGDEVMIREDERIFSVRLKLLKA